ncbi:MAG TPA: hypothetical protein VJA94_18640 [Candidatus Angelobacter sp.]
MKSRVRISLLFAGMFVAAFALAQNQPAPKNPDAQSADPLFFIKIAADVTANVQPFSEGRLAIYVSEQNWAEGLKDSDLGPFLKVKEAKAGRSAAFLFNEARDLAVCVYFDGKSAFGVVAVKAGTSGGIKPEDIAAAYKPITKDMLKKGIEEPHFSPSDVNTDDGVALPAFIVTK